jgi:DNA polymerase-3 subunit beta
MKITVDAGLLARKLALLAPLMRGERIILPILDCVGLSLEETRLWLQASDGETVMRVALDVSVQKAGDPRCVPFDPLLKLANTIKGPLTIQFNKQALVVKSERGDYKVGAKYDFDDMPFLRPTPSMLATLSGQDAEAIKERVSWACSQDELRPAMTGVLFDFDSDGMTAVATDAHAMAMLRLPIKREEAAQVVVPITLLRLVHAARVETWIMTEGDGAVGFASREVEITGRKIDARYPQYRQVIPPEEAAQCRLSFSKDWIDGVCARAKMYADSDDQKMVLHLQEGPVIVKAESRGWEAVMEESSKPKESEDEVTMTGWGGGEGHLALHPVLARKAARACASDTITMQYHGEARASVFEGGSVKVLVMPILLK